MNLRTEIRYLFDCLYVIISAVIGFFFAYLVCEIGHFFFINIIGRFDYLDRIGVLLLSLLVCVAVIVLQLTIAEKFFGSENNG